MKKTKLALCLLLLISLLSISYLYINDKVEKSYEITKLDFTISSKGDLIELHYQYNFNNYTDNVIYAYPFFEPQVISSITSPITSIEIPADSTLNGVFTINIDINSPKLDSEIKDFLLNENYSPLDYFVFGEKLQFE